MPSIIQSSRTTSGLTSSTRISASSPSPVRVTSIAGPFEVEGHEVGQRAIILDQQQELVGHCSPAGLPTVAHVLAGRRVINHLRDIRGVIATRSMFLAMKCK